MLRCTIQLDSNQQIAFVQCSNSGWDAAQFGMEKGHWRGHRHGIVLQIQTIFARLLALFIEIEISRGTPVGEVSHVDRCIIFLAERQRPGSIIFGLLRSDARSARPVVITNVTTAGLSLLGASDLICGAEVEILLRNVGWTKAHVCISDEAGCDVIFASCGNPIMSLAA